jgi:membrane protease YdiL (CAAX protease family)
MTQNALLLLELIVVFVLFWADIHRWRHVVIFSKTPYLLVLGWISLRLRGRTWRSVGLFQPDSWPRVLVIGILAGCAIEALELFITQPLLASAFHQPPDLSAVAELRGNPGMLAVAVLLSWTLAAFGEELVWRGYLLNRFAEAFGSARWSWASAIVVTSVAFGLAHYDQGRTGIVENMIDGALLCAVYLASGRNLWAPILAHGVTDTIDSILLFAGHYPMP